MEIFSNSSTIEVIIKITERCNINCSYCYMFNRNNTDYLANPPYISKNTISDIAKFIIEGSQELQINKVNIVLHGGEPLMMKKARFDELCQILRDIISPVAHLTLGVQTNAILIDDEWIEILNRHKIFVGVSLDGPKEINDIYRIGHDGGSTHEGTIQGLKRLHSAWEGGHISYMPGVICVITPGSDPKQVYKYFTETLGLRHVSFNLPMETHDTWDAEDAQKMKDYLVGLFDVWIENDNPDVRIRMFDQMLRFFAGDKQLRRLLPHMLRQHLMVVISSDGELSEHDDYKVINFAQRGGNVRTTSLRQFANSELRTFIDSLYEKIPTDCQPCKWKYYCRAGITQGLGVTRYSQKKGFNNRSVMCEAFLEMYERGASFLLQNGLSESALTESLQPSDRDKSAEFQELARPPSSLFERRIIPLKYESVAQVK